MNYFKLPIYALAAALMAAPTLANAWWWDDDDDDEEEPFDEARLFFELNDTDGDLGIHGKIDGGPWKRMKIEGPDGRYERTLLNVRAYGKLRRQGMTELFFESAEPKFVAEEEGDETLDPAVFFNRFKEGEYDIEGRTLDGEELESEVYLSHIIPAAPEVTMIGEASGPEEDECWVSGKGPDDDVIITWNEVTQSHFARWTDANGEPLDEDKIPLGNPGMIDVLYYEFVVEVDETPWKATSIIPPGDGVTISKTIPADFFALTADDADGEYKFEILVRAKVRDEDGIVMVNIDGDIGPLPGNKSAVEDCFEYGS
ncbi:MAG: hypothetical protein KJN95_00770 [Gammaproteobacteria bacterium]|nr:hypothetical protein [Gammaproteobacteria bacterium]MBT8437883.1 hypothetical protein [Gammaproteobacteria bacterium]